MAYLNFRDEALKVELAEDSKWKWQATFTLQSTMGEKMRAGLEELLKTEAPGVEIRMDFSQGWTLFWKLKEGEESRLLLAHPEKEEWVATFVLARAHLDAVLEKFRKKESFRLSESGRVAKLSNVEFEARFE